MSKTLNNFIAAFDNFGKALLVLSATSGIVASFSIVIDALVGGIASASLSLLFSFSDDIAKKRLNNEKKKEKET